MPSRTSTGATVRVSDSSYFLPDSVRADFQNRYIQFAARRAFRDSTSLSVKVDAPYPLNISPVTPWLPSVERRIGDSIIPSEYESLVSGEWLHEEVGLAAIRFFQNTADLLPGEPFIYASQTGALVAEFGATRGALTTVISPESVILFGVNVDNPATPIGITVKRGSNRLREDVKEVVQTLAGAHGQMGTTK